MRTGTTVLNRLAENNPVDHRKGSLLERVRRISLKLDDIDRKIAKGKAQLIELRQHTENERLSLLALMAEGRYNTPTSRSVSRTFKSKLERMQGKAYSQEELSGRMPYKAVETGLQFKTDDVHVAKHRPLPKQLSQIDMRGGEGVEFKRLRK